MEVKVPLKLKMEIKVEKYRQGEDKPYEVIIVDKNPDLKIENGITFVEIDGDVFDEANEKWQQNLPRLD